MKSILFYLCSCFALLNSISLQQSCQNTPFWKLNICEIDCEKCGANGLCQICPDNFNLIKTKCDEDQDLVYRYTYFTQKELTSTSIQQYNFKLSNQYLQESSIVTVCKASSYQFDMIGLFKQQDRLTFNLNFETPVTSVIFKFNFLTISANTKLELIMNGNQIFQKKFGGSKIANTYEPYDDDHQTSYLSIPSLTESSSGVFINKINAGQVAFDFDQFKNNVYLQIEVSITNDPRSSISFWGFSDFSIVGKKCENCLPQRLKTLSKNVGIAIGVNVGALIVLISILYGCVKFEERKRRRSLQQNSNDKHFSRSFDKEDQKEEEKQDRLHLRQTIERPKDMSPNHKKNKIS